MEVFIIILWTTQLLYINKQQELSPAEDELQSSK